MHWIKFRAIRNKVNSELKKAKKNYFCNKIEDCARAKDPKQSWKLINNLLGKNNKSNNISQLKVEDVIISDDIKIAESFNDFFVNIGAKLANEIEINSTDFTSFQSVPSRPDIQFKFSEISTHEVCLQLRNLKTSKSTGIDTIPARALKIAAEIISPSLTWIFNLSIKTGIYVEEWKKAWVLPIYKSEDRQKCENYRPISILPIISKIFERLVFNQLYKYLNEHSLLSKYQSGFRPKNSTLSALIQMCDAWYTNMDNGDLSGVVFLDIRKAFDSINHDILLRKMKEQFGVSNIEFKWFESYISNREQVCFVNGTMSTPRNLVCGVPQGSILGPLLFLLYINDLPNNLKNTIPCLYADDTQIFSSANDYQHLVFNLNSDLNNISQWLKQNKLQHHSSKTKVMYVGSKHNLHKINNDIPVMLNGQPIPRAISEPMYSVAYANMCRCLFSIKVADAEGKKTSFRKLLLNRCQKEFERKTEDEEAFAEKLKQLEGLS
ncbi:RNA-directed DNA polymerase from mobile element jockey-like, partial [Paramuricea clavata]